MAASRVPGPADVTRPPEAPGDDSGLIGAGFPPGPVGEEIPLDTPTTPKAAPSAAPSGGQAQQGELNLVGSFPLPSSMPLSPMNNCERLPHSGTQPSGLLCP